MKVTYQKVDLLENDCAACELALGLSVEQVGYITPSGEKKVWHLTCAPEFLKAAYSADNGVLDG